MTRFTYIILGLSLFFLISLSIGINFLNDKEIENIIISGKINGLVNLSLAFLTIFILLRIRDLLLNTKFPIELINSNALASSIYYSVSIFSFAYIVTSSFN